MRIQNRTPARTLLVAACWFLAALAAAYVLIAHRVHVVEWLPFGLLLACPLMHIFMHGRHGHHQQSAEDLGRGPAAPSSRSTFQG
jgi:hypothetical protein